MIVAFCGHGDFLQTQEITKRMMKVLEEEIGESSAELFLGGYGNFDAFAHACGKAYKSGHKNVSLTLVTPYMTDQYQKKHLEPVKGDYDTILYPDLEGKPLRFAISYRNKFMIEQAHLVIAYVNHEWGGAYKTLQHAKRKGKKIVNLGTLL